jgi:hypothetical protein
MVGRSYQGPSSSAQGPCEPASLSAGGIFSPLHQATGLHRFSPPFYGFCASAKFFFDMRCNILLEVTSRTQHRPPSNSKTRAFGGLNHLEGFLPLASEGYNISKARTSSMADLPLSSA